VPAPLKWSGAEDLPHPGDFSLAWNRESSWMGHYAVQAVRHWRRSRKFVLFKDAGWDYRTLNFERDAPRAKEMTTARSISRSEFAGVLCARRKADPVSRMERSADPPLHSVRYYTSVLEAMGGRAKCKVVPMFMAPGMQHCGGGPGQTSSTPWRRWSAGANRV